MMRLFVTFALAVCLTLPARAEVKITEVVSPGGITAWLVQEPSIPFMALELRFRGGASLERSEEQGLANLLTSTLDEGAGLVGVVVVVRALERASGV